MITAAERFTCADCDRNGVSRSLPDGPPVRACPDCGGRMLVYPAGVPYSHPLLTLALENSQRRREEARRRAAEPKPNTSDQPNKADAPPPEEH